VLYSWKPLHSVHKGLRAEKANKKEISQGIDMTIKIEEKIIDQCFVSNSNYVVIKYIQLTGTI